MESIVTSLEWSKKLKEVGWPQELEVEGQLATYGYCVDAECNCEELHLIHHDNDEGGTVGNDYSHRLKDYDEKPHAFILAPTAEEILRKLPKEDDEWGTLAVTWDDSRWCVGYYTFGSRNEKSWNAFIHQGSLCDSLACMYVYLSELKLLPPL